MTAAGFRLVKIALVVTPLLIGGTALALARGAP